MITFSNDKYLFSHGKAPRGCGQWAFQLGRNGRMVFWFGTLSDAKKAVKDIAKREGFMGTIYVMP